jgi:hypothetical protein
MLLQYQQTSVTIPVTHSSSCLSTTHSAGLTIHVQCFPMSASSFGIKVASAIEYVNSGNVDNVLVRCGFCECRVPFFREQMKATVMNFDI